MSPNELVVFDGDRSHGALQTTLERELTAALPPHSWLNTEIASESGSLSPTVETRATSRAAGYPDEAQDFSVFVGVPIGAVDRRKLYESIYRVRPPMHRSIYTPTNEEVRKGVLASNFSRCIEKVFSVSLVHSQFISLTMLSIGVLYFIVAFYANQREHIAASVVIVISSMLFAAISPALRRIPSE